MNTQENQNINQEMIEINRKVEVAIKKLLMESGINPEIMKTQYITYTDAMFMQFKNLKHLNSIGKEYNDIFTELKNLETNKKK